MPEGSKPGDAENAGAHDAARDPVQSSCNCRHETPQPS